MINKKLAIVNPNGHNSRLVLRVLRARTKSTYYSFMRIFLLGVTYVASEVDICKTV